MADQITHPATPEVPAPAAADLGQAANAAAAATAEISQEEQDRQDENEVRRILNFDPFADAAAPAPAAQAPGTTPNEPATQTPATPDAGAAATTTPPATPQVSPEVAALQEQVRNLQTQIKTTPAAAPTAQPQGEAPDPVPAYNYNIPDDVMVALDSDEPVQRKAGIAALAQGVSRTVHRQVLDQMQAVFQNVVPQMIEQSHTVRQTAMSVRQDFYGKFKELDNPQLYPFVQQQAILLGQELGGITWSPEFRDTLGQRVKAALQSASGTIAPQVPQPAPAAAPAPFLAGGNARPGSVRGNPTDDISDTLFG